MKPLLFVAAEPRECNPWVGHWESSSPVALPVHWARSGTYRGQAVIAIANGAGPARAAAAVACAPEASAVVSIGFCGALAQDLRIGDVFIATRVRNGTREWDASVPPGPRARTGVLASQDRIARTAAEKSVLRETGACAVEMEAAAVARASEELQVPFYCIRAVSDLAGEDLANDFNAVLMPDGRFSVSRLVIGALQSPVSRFSELLRLSRRTALASKNLGEFLADCRF